MGDYYAPDQLPELPQPPPPGGAGALPPTQNQIPAPNADNLAQAAAERAPEDVTPIEAIAAIATDKEKLLSEMHSAAHAFPPSFECFFNDIHVNRAPNLVCYDHSRVLLTDKLGKSNYYHASYVDSYQGKAGYVFAQAPFNAKTAELFWRTVVTSKPAVIICLGAVDEDQGKGMDNYLIQLDSESWRNGYLNKYGIKNIEEVESRLHVAMYFWPQTQGSKTVYGKISLTNKGVTQDRHMDSFTIEIAAAGQVNTTKLVYFKQWMDDSPMPEYIMDNRAMIKIEHVRAMKLPTAFKGPIMLTCPSGISRCGVYAALDIISHRVAEEAAVGLIDTMMAIKSQRYGCFRNMEHYLLMREMLLRAIITAGGANDEAIGDKMPSKKAKKVVKKGKKGKPIKPKTLQLRFGK